MVSIIEKIFIILFKIKLRVSVCDLNIFFLYFSFCRVTFFTCSLGGGGSEFFKKAVKCG